MTRIFQNWLPNLNLTIDLDCSHYGEILSWVLLSMVDSYPPLFAVDKWSSPFPLSILIYKL